MRVIPRLLPTVLLLAACGAVDRSTLETASAAGMTPMAWDIRSYSETVPFTSVTRMSGSIYAGTPAGVIRFNEQSGDFVRLTQREGLTGDHVLAVSGAQGSGLWVATDNGLARSRDGVWTNFAMGNPPGEAVSTMVATRWGVWAGGSNGLGRFRDGKWTGYLPGARITALLGDVSGGGVWVGTDGEGIHHWESEGRFVNHSPAIGQSLRRIRGLAFTKNGAVVAVGSGEGGHGLVFFDGTYWTTYLPRPAGHLRWVQTGGDDLLLAYEDRILVVRSVVRPEAPLPAGPVALQRVLAPEAPAGYPAPRYYTEPLRQWLPPDATVVLAEGSGVLIGTRTAGLVRFDGKQARWFRTADLVGQGDKLRMACAGDSCFVAGGGNGYRFHGETFDRVVVDPEPTTRVAAFLDGPSHSVLALLAPADGKSLVLWKLAPGAEAGSDAKRTATEGGGKPSGAWMRQREYAISIPQGRVEVGFARAADNGKIWVGLGCRENEGNVLPWGVALLRPDGTVLYHRSTLLPTEDRPPGSLALPDDVRDVRMLGDGAMWLATGTGACRVKGTQVVLYTENEGLESEIVHTLGRSLNGQILAATHGGLGQFDGKQWRFDFEGPLSSSVRALLRDGDVLWIGTARGLIRLHRDGRQELIDSRQGLANDEVLDLYRDPRARLWVLTAKGLSVITRPSRR